MRKLSANIRPSVSALSIRYFRRKNNGITIRFERGTISHFRRYSVTSGTYVRDNGLRSSDATTSSRRIYKRFIQLRRNLANVCMLTLLRSISNERSENKPNISRCLFSLGGHFILTKSCASYVFKRREDDSIVRNCVELIFCVFVVFLARRKCGLIFPHRNGYVRFKLILVVIVMSFFHVFQFIGRDFNESASCICAYSSMRLEKAFRSNCFPVPFNRFNNRWLTTLTRSCCSNVVLFRFGVS